MVKINSGILTLSGANTYTGNTTINAGTLQAGITTVTNISGAFGVNSAVVMGNFSGATLNISGYNTQIGSITGGGNLGGNTILGGNALTIGADNTSPSAYAGIISGTGSITKIGTGTIILSGLNSYTGGTNINSGVLSINTVGLINQSSSIGAATNVSNSTGYLVFNGGTLQYTGVSGINNLNYTLNSTGIFNITQSGSILTMAGINAGSGGITVTGSGTLLLAAQQYNSGLTTVSSGSNLTYGSISMGTSAILSGSAISILGTLNYNTPFNSSTSGILSGNGNIIMNGTGTWTLSGNDTFSGYLTMNGGSIIHTSGTVSFPTIDFGITYGSNNVIVASSIAITSSPSLTPFTINTHTISGVPILSGSYALPLITWAGTATGSVVTGTGLLTGQSLV